MSRMVEPIAPTRVRVKREFEEAWEGTVTGVVHADIKVPGSTTPVKGDLQCYMVRDDRGFELYAYPQQVTLID